MRFLNRIKVLTLYLSIIGCVVRNSLAITIQDYTEHNNRNADEAAANNELLVLMPAGLNLTDIPFNLDNFQLLKLNTDVLFDKSEVSVEDHSGKEQNDGAEARSLSSEAATSGSRGARKLNLFRGVWNKPRISPLYLVNGTVCRFVNAVPICTTLATTGLIPNSPSPNSSTQNPNSLIRTNNLPNNQQLNNQQQPFRPAALMDDDSRELNVGASNSTDYSPQVSSSNNNNNNNIPAAHIQTARPMNLMLVSRRPMNLLSIGNRRRPT